MERLTHECLADQLAQGVLVRLLVESSLMSDF